ncbi:MAG: putative porin [Planctomycetes bacterium]|nr:putative porin [Planctomycetota bacterium]
MSGTFIFAALLGSFILPSLPSSWAQDADPLAELLIQKGVIRRADLGTKPATRDALIDALRTKGILTEAEAESLGRNAPASRQEAHAVREEIQASSQKTSASEAAKFPSWLEGLDCKGDFRARYEGFDFDGSDRGQADQKQRNRHRFRLRAGFEKKWDGGVAAGLRLASGNPDDPISTNSTLGDGLDPDAVSIDRAFLAYRPEFAEWLWITAGRFENPFVSTDMVFDPDLNLEGLAEKLSCRPVEKVQVFALLGQVTLNESGGGTDSLLWAWQGGVDWKVTDSVATTLAFATYNYQNPDGSAELITETTAAGNSGVGGANPQLTFDYRLIDVVNKWKFELAGRPLEVWWNVVFNVGDDRPGLTLEEDLGWSAGMKLGKLKQPNDWDISLAYKHIEADAVFAAFNDSDFQGSNREGFVISTGWQALKRLELRASTFVTQNIEDAGFNAAAQDFIRWQLDAIVKF